MSSRMIILLAVLGLPYGYLLLEWGRCLVGVCQIDGHMIFYTLVAVCALPFVLAIIGGALALGGARRVVGAPSTGGGGAARMVEGARGGVRFWVGVALMAAILPACAALLGLVLDTPEPGRDRLGRICETSSGATTCRPDPDRKGNSELEMLNAAVDRQRERQRDAGD
jgi:hypothetical protein